MRWLQTSRVAALPGSNQVVQAATKAKTPAFHTDEDRELFGAALTSLRTLNGPTSTNTRLTGAEFNTAGVALPQSWFIASWFILVALHSACGVYLILNGYLHVYLTTPQMVYISGFTADKNAWHFRRAAILYAFIGALHLAQVASILVASVYNRAFVFRHKPCNGQRGSWSRLMQRAPGSTVVDSFTKIASQAFESQGLLDYQGGFMKVFTVQEIIVVLSQTYQANRCCNLLSRTWINLLYVALVIANCWVIPALCYYVRGQPLAVIRAALLSVDALFNMGSCFVFPFVIFWPYYCAFDTTTGGFPASMQYDSTWQSQLITEMQMVFALSLPDLFSKILNNLTVFASLMGVSRLLIPQQKRSRSPIRSSIVRTSSRASNKNSPTDFTVLTKTNRWITVLQRLLVAWGVSILAIYCAALSRTRTPLVGCNGLAHPWFSTKYSCSIFELNCFRRQVESPTSADLDVLNPDTLLFLGVSHCPGVKVPAEIQNFQNLLGFHLHNCTIVEWSAASSISATKHTRMTAVVVSRSNMTSFPEGLLQPMPAMLSAIVFSHTNLTTLPTGLSEVWKPILHLMFDYSNVQEIPESILQLDVVSFSFVGNHIRHLPSLDGIHKAIPLIDMAINPLQELPATIGTGAVMGLLNIEGSNVSSFPPWIATNVGLAAASGSPYCALPVEQRAASTLCFPMNPNSIGRLNITLLDEKIPL